MANILDWVALLFPVLGAYLLIWDQNRKGKLTKLLLGGVLLIFWGFTAVMLNKFNGKMDYIIPILIVAVGSTAFAIYGYYIDNKSKPK